MNTLSIHNLYAKHRKQLVLHNINLDLNSGELAILVGPNGCGKSTLLRNIARLHKPVQGTIWVGKHKLWNMTPKVAARHLAFLPQSPQAPQGITARSLVRLGRHPYQTFFRQWSAFDEQIVEEALCTTGIEHFCDQPLDELSGGQRQRCWLAMALAQDTPILLLDEPTSMLDLGHQIEVLNQIKQLSTHGRSILVVLHDLGLAARYADRIIAMKAGHIIADGSPQAIMTPELIHTLYGVHAEVFQSATTNTLHIAPIPQHA